MINIVKYVYMMVLCWAGSLLLNVISDIIIALKLLKDKSLDLGTSICVLVGEEVASLRPYWCPYG